MAYKAPQRKQTRARVVQQMLDHRDDRLRKWAEGGARTPVGATLLANRQVATDLLGLLEETEALRQVKNSADELLIALERFHGTLDGET